MNTLKYLLGISTTLIFEYKSVTKDNVLSDNMKIICLIIITAASLFSLCWDLIMDWNMSPWGFRSYAAPSSTPTSSTATLSTSTDSTYNSSDSERRDEETGIVKKEIGKMGRFSMLFYSFAVIFDVFGRSINIIKALCYFDSCKNIRCMFEHDVTFIYAIIEAFRRYIWSIIRLENYQSQLLYLESNK